MKIFHIITQMEAGGAQGAAVRNANYFNENGVDSSVVFLYTKRNVYSGDNIISLSNKAPQSVWDVLVIVRKLYILLKSNPDCRVICYTHYANVIGALVSFAAGVRNVVVSHRNPVQTYPNICRYIDYVVGLTPLYYRSICVSKTVVQSFSNYPERYKNKIQLVYNGINFQKYNDGMAQNSFQWIRESAGGRLVLLSTGRLHPQKNQIVLLKAMASVTNAKLFIAGEGELREEFEREIQTRSLEDRVVLIGEIPPESIASFLSVGDAFLFPSSYEAFGFSVVEAMAAALPIICSDIPAMQEIVGDAGILLDKDNENIWSEKIKGLDKSMLEELAASSLERAKIFSLTEMASSYLKIVTES